MNCSHFSAKSRGLVQMRNVLGGDAYSPFSLVFLLFPRKRSASSSYIISERVFLVSEWLSGIECLFSIPKLKLSPLFFWNHLTVRFLLSVLNSCRTKKHSLIPTVAALSFVGQRGKDPKVRIQEKWVSGNERSATDVNYLIKPQINAWRKPRPHFSLHSQR